MTNPETQGRTTAPLEEVDVLLVFPSANRLREDRVDPPLGLLAVGSTLLQAGLTVIVVDQCGSTGLFLDALPRPRVVGMSLWTTNFSAGMQLAQTLRRRWPDARLICGGPHVTALPHSALSTFDVAITGEGDLAVVDVVQNLLNGLPQASIVHAGIVNDLDALPPVDYSLVDVRSYSRTVAGIPAVSILTSRGCPYRCTFCNSIVMGKGVPARWRSAKAVIAEVMNLNLLYGAEAFRITDDTFTLRPRRILEIGEGLKGTGFRFRCFAKADRTDERMAVLLSAMGVTHVSMGVESGSPSLLAMMKKGQTVDEVRRAIAACKDVGISVRVYLIVGYPGESWDTLRETRDLMIECKPDEYAVYPIIAYPGTELHEHAPEYGIQNIDIDTDNYYQVYGDREASYSCDTSSLSRAEIRKMRLWLIRELETTISWAGDSVLYK